LASSRLRSRFSLIASPATYAILLLTCLLYAGTVVLSTYRSGFQGIGNGPLGIFEFGAIGGDVLERVGASLPWPVDRAEPWRLVTAIFLHGSLPQMALNMWVLFDVGTAVEQLYGSARDLFVYVATGAVAYVASSAFWNFSAGASGAVLGLCGAMLATYAKSRAASGEVRHACAIRTAIYAAIICFLPLQGFIGASDYAARIAGFVAGLVVGAILMPRRPATTSERIRAYALGCATGLVVVASFAAIAFELLQRS
jgi:rhomboid protease GluP